MADNITPTDIEGLLIEHEKFHQRLAAGEFEDEGGGERFERVLTEEHLRPFIEQLGPRSVADLLHLVHEALIVVLNDIEFEGEGLKQDYTQKEKELHDYVAYKIAVFMQWASMSALTGRFDPWSDEEGPQPSMHLGEL